MCYHIKQTQSDRNYIENSFLADLKMNVVPTYYHSNGFARPLMMIITEKEPNLIQSGIWSVAPPKCQNIEKYWQEKGGSVLNTRNDSLFSYRSANWKTEAILDQKCIALVTGFYEPHKVGKESYPYLLYRPGFEIFGLCGYYTEQKHGKTFSVLTSGADDYMSKIHNAAKRMPMTLYPEDKESYFNLKSEEALKGEFAKQYRILLNHRAVERSVLNTRIDNNHERIIQEIFHPIITDF